MKIATVASSLSMFRRPTAVRLVTPTWRVGDEVGPRKRRMYGWWIEKPIQFGRSIKLNCTPWVKTFWTTCHMKSIWGTDNVIGYQPFLGHKVEQLIFNRVWCRWLDVDKKVQSQKNKSSRLQGLLLQAEKNNLNKTLQYLSWGLQLALDVGLPDHRV